MGTTQTDPEATGFAEFDHTAQQISDRASDNMRRAPGQPRFATSTLANIHQHPFASLLAAGALGWVLGLLAGRR
ncbi:DUF883 C-terminal domain-containing protein [Roseomonas sp. KE0001]|uniref:DUF883 C-terminal domain-containing protein n=1 Tax=Roseomonas sp. KE0001 TaxID=2479201 RepID=UPI0018DFF9D6|nr:DUF883 C-terminal domain-containing protein [Roseomonas sp. KE0001]